VGPFHICAVCLGCWTVGGGCGALDRRGGSGTVGKGSPVGVGFVFTTTGERAVSGISMAKERLDQRMLELLRAALTNAGQDGCRADRGRGVDAA